MRTMSNYGGDDLLLSITNVQKSFGDFKVLNNINLNINRGEVVVIIGPSGSGKSTLLRSLIKLEDIDSGEICVDNDIMVRSKNGNPEYASLEILKKIRLKFGMVFQNFPLFPHMTVLENIIFSPIKVFKMEKNIVCDYGRELLKKVGLEKANVYPGDLSGGQKQRVSIARALAMRPEIMLFDEPTSALDPGLAKEVLLLIKEIALQEKKTMVIVTHNLKFAEEIADRVVFMYDGVIVDQGVPQEMFCNPKSIKLKDFLLHI